MNINLKVCLKPQKQHVSVSAAINWKCNCFWSSNRTNLSTRVVVYTIWAIIVGPLLFLHIFEFLEAFVEIKIEPLQIVGRIYIYFL